MQLTSSLLTAVAILVCVQVRAGETKGLTPRDLVGVYRITAGEHGGKAIPAKELKVDRVAFTEDEVTVLDKATKKVYAASYKLDGAKVPTRIHMVGLEPKKGETADGLIEKKGNMVRLIYALPGGKVPTEFKTSEKQQMFTLKKVTGK
jgi:uncharacterized protein (TIGR03067 family)